MLPKFVEEITSASNIITFLTAVITFSTPPCLLRCSVLFYSDPPSTVVAFSSFFFFFFFLLFSDIPDGKSEGGDGWGEEGCGGCRWHGAPQEQGREDK